MSRPPERQTAASLSDGLASGLSLPLFSNPPGIVFGLVAVVWVAAGLVLLFDLGHLPYRLLNRGRSKPFEEAAITPLYWRAWGAILLGAGAALLLYVTHG